MTFLSAIFGCMHKNTTFPQTNEQGTYVACLECGKEFGYDWEEMRIVKALRTEIRQATEELEVTVTQLADFLDRQKLGGPQRTHAENERYADQGITQ